ncbi:hypothetical protein ABT124_45005 [Streptomyces sp. NPDC001982]|uniref:hypothetical protein n=1 Tax=Streptomyces sp. NPDC001982 TaxID=3154405 RepID=UPI003325EFC4
MLHHLAIARTLRRLAPLAVAAALTAVASSPALAGNVWQIQTANSPSTGAPIAGGGSWIVNKPSGYYLGRSLSGWEFDNEQTTSANWHYGRAITRLNMCGWAMPGSMGVFVRSVSDSCSDTTKSTLSHRLTIGRDFNAPAHATGDGTVSPANTGCTLYYNYFHGTDFTSNGGNWADSAGAPSGTVMYRFTTRDGQAAVVRDPNLGWGFLPIACVTRPSALYNDND